MTCSASSSGRIVRIDGQFVVRRTGYWTPAVHGLLRHLEQRGFAYSPRVLGIDDHGNELLRFMPGDSGEASWIKVVPEYGLRAMARLLRSYHDAVDGYRPSQAVWALHVGGGRPGELICHGDFGPWNIVWRGAEPVGIIDWDLAGPRPAMYDLAYALEYCVPFRDDQECLRWLGYSEPPDRADRLRVFAEAYGLPSAAGLVDAVIQVQVSTIDQVSELAQKGIEPQVTWVHDGYLHELRRRVEWSQANRRLFGRN